MRMLHMDILLSRYSPEACLDSDTSNQSLFGHPDKENYKCIQKEHC